MKIRETLPQTLHRKRIYILPTSQGFLFILILIAMLLGSANYNNNLGFLLVFLLGSMAFVSILHTFGNLAGTEIVSVRAKPVFASEKAVFEFLVRVSSVRAEISFVSDSAEEVCGEILPDTDNCVRVRIPADRRGIFRPGPVRIYTRYPLGLFYAWSFLDPDMECLVYPVPISGELMFSDARTWASDHESGGRKSGGIDDFQGLKPYQPGDSLRLISWKAFSGGRGLFTKSFTGQSGAFVMPDWHALKETDTEQKISRLCGMILKAERLNLPYGLRLPDMTIEPDKGEAHKNRCLKALAVFDDSLIP